MENAAAVWRRGFSALDPPRSGARATPIRSNAGTRIGVGWMSLPFRRCAPRYRRAMRRSQSNPGQGSARAQARPRKAANRAGRHRACSWPGHAQATVHRKMNRWLPDRWSAAQTDRRMQASLRRLYSLDLELYVSIDTQPVRSEEHTSELQTPDHLVC